LLDYERFNEGIFELSTSGGLIAQLFPLIFAQVFYAVSAFIISRKRGTNLWTWTVASLIPVLGLFAGAVFSYVMLAALFDRIRALEGRVGME